MSLMAKKVFHIVPQDDAWALKSEGNASPVATFPTQREAIDEGRKMATEDPDEVDLIIHRTNGTIRERLSFGETDQPTPRNTNRLPAPALQESQTVIAPRQTTQTTTTSTTEGHDRERPKRVGPEDIFSVGTRVSWGAIAAGVVVALALQVLLGMLALATGLSVSHTTSTESLTFGAVITAAVALFASLFLGGLVATRITAGETQVEAVTYGVLVWGAMFLLGSVLATTALGSLGYGDLYRRATAGLAGQVTPPRVSQDAMTRAGLSETDQANLLGMLDKIDQANQSDAALNARKAAWWSFALILLSLMTAIGGALLGCGPELIFRRLRERDGRVALPPPTTPAAPTPAGRV